MHGLTAKEPFSRDGCLLRLCDCIGVLNVVLEKDQEEEEKGFKHVGCCLLVWLNVDIDEEDTCEHEMPEALSRKEELWSKHNTGGCKYKMMQWIQCNEMFYRKFVSDSMYCLLAGVAGDIPPTEESTCTPYVEGPCTYSVCNVINGQ